MKFEFVCLNVTLNRKEFSVKRAEEGFLSQKDVDVVNNNLIKKCY
ncbi:hypothetical protein SAMN04488491_0331 [Psychrobacter sp. LV10R520-6]|nr:hypothetical protein SAMN04488491_0331 [Psychrobacter sp. LV10R520-6]